MYYVIRFSGKTGNKAFAVVPRCWFDGKEVRWSKSADCAKKNMKPQDSWPKYAANLATPNLYASYEEADSALDEILVQTETESEQELRGKRQSKKKRNAEYSYTTETDDEIEDAGIHLITLLAISLFY